MQLIQHKNTLVVHTSPYTKVLKGGREEHRDTSLARYNSGFQTKTLS